MASFDYDGAAQDAYDLIKEFGQSANLYHQAKSAPASPYEPDIKTAVSYAVIGVANSYAFKDIDGQVIKWGDLRLTIPAKGLNYTPVSGDKVIWSGRTYSVMSVEPFQPAGVAITYDLQLRI